MSSFLHRSCIGAAVVAVTAIASPATAAPVVPAGWHGQPDAEGGTKVYRSERGALSAEFRVHPAEETQQPLIAWFESRRLSPVPGYRGGFRPGKPSNASLIYANGDGVDSAGRKVYLIRMGCQRTKGGMVLADAMLTADAGYLKQVVPEMGVLFEAACFGDGPPVLASAPATTATTATTATAATTKPRAAAPVDAPYAFVTAPGKGLKASDIEAVLYEWTNEQSGMTMQVHTYFYLLLKDGSYRHGLPPVALEDFDAAAARAAEGNAWGRWKRVGAQYEILRNGAQRPGRLNANSARQPARPGETLDGTWAVDTAYSTAWSVARSHREIQFGSDGSFVRNSGSGVVGSMGSQAAGNAVGGTVTRHNDTSTATLGGAVATSGSTRRRPSTLPDRSGTYRLAGYTLELHYDNGRVERLPFVAEGKRASIYFNGEELIRAKAR